MNPEQLLTELVGKAHRLRGGGIENMHICIWDGKLDVRSNGHTTKPHRIIYQIRLVFFTEGLTPNAWSKLAAKCYNAQKGKKSWQIQSERLTLPKPTNS